MNEGEWFASSSPKAMLDYLRYVSYEEPVYGGTTTQSRSKPLIDDRRLRLWVEACRAALEAAEGVPTVWHDLGEHSEDLPACVNTWSGSEYYSRYLPLAKRAAILRCIAGNPFRPLRHPPVEPPNVFESLSVLAGAARSGAVYLHAAWLTPRVVALAEAAYAETGRACERCKGTGRSRTPDVVTLQWMRNGGEYPFAPPTKSNPCPACHGTGRIADGTLDTARLALLSDALEEAGCEDEPILRHLRGEEPDWRQMPKGEPSQGKEWVRVGWRPKGVPCVRGCHVVDAILGKE